jgi:hypothetical protein
MLVLHYGPASAALFRRPVTRGRGRSNITLRKRLHVNTLITDPGTAEIDWSSLFSLSTSNFAMPSAVRYTPPGTHILWGRTEYSLGFDSLINSQEITLTALSVVHDGEKLDVAVAPQAQFFVSTESGGRFGAVGIARYDSGRNSLGATLSWSGATRASPSNPAGLFNAGFGFGRRLSGTRFAERLTPHFNAVWERATGHTGTVSFFEGMEYQMTERLAFDLSGQHLDARGASPDHQVVFGLTLSLGKPR